MEFMLRKREYTPTSIVATLSVGRMLLESTVIVVMV